MGRIVSKDLLLRMPQALNIGIGWFYLKLTLRTNSQSPGGSCAGYLQRKQWIPSLSVTSMKPTHKISQMCKSGPNMLWLNNSSLIVFHLSEEIHSWYCNPTKDPWQERLWKLLENLLFLLPFTSMIFNFILSTYLYSFRRVQLPPLIKVASLLSRQNLYSKTQLVKI